MRPPFQVDRHSKVYHDVMPFHHLLSLLTFWLLSNPSHYYLTLLHRLPTQSTSCHDAGLKEMLASTRCRPPEAFLPESTSIAESSERATCTTAWTPTIGTRTRRDARTGEETLVPSLPPSLPLPKSTTKCLRPASHTRAG